MLTDADILIYRRVTTVAQQGAYLKADRRDAHYLFCLTRRSSVLGRGVNQREYRVWVDTRGRA